jgi:ABC-type transport system involved in multi-copper enzyme maturation permease subunit
MIWTTWRQHRSEAAVGALILAALTAALLAVGSAARHRARALGLSACANTSKDCSDALAQLHRDFHAIPPFTFALIAVPLIAGMFWAAPLVSREYEAGTHHLAWTQSISPLRWITTKITLIFAAVAAAALVLGLVSAWTLDPLSPAFGGRYNSTWYDVTGIVPVSCMLFALALGVAASALIRRTLPAMAATLTVYAAARIPIHWIRWHFAPLSTHTLAIPLSTLLENPMGAPRDLATQATPLGGWLHTLTITGPNGHPIGTNSGNFNVLQDYCPNLQVDPSRTGVLNPQGCATRVHNLALHETISYQSPSHFWLIQTIESAIFVGLAALLVTVAILAVSRRRPT